MNNLLKIFLFLLLFLLLHTLHPNILFSQLVSDFKLNDDTTNQPQYDAKIGTDKNGNFTVVWTDWREEGTEGVNVNVYCQRFLSNAEFVGDNFRINEITGSSSSPDIAVRGNGSFLVCWKDFGVKARIFNNQGIPFGATFRINDSLMNTVINTPKVGTDSIGRYVICWQEYVIGQYGNIFFQRLDSSGNKIGNNIKVNDDTVSVEHENPSIIVKTDGSFIITWNDFRPPAIQDGDDIYFQMYDRFGNKDGVNEKVNDDFGPLNLQHSPKISADSSGDFIIAWNDDRLDITNNEVFGQRFDSKGLQINSNFRVTQSSISIVKGLASVYKRANGDFIIYWTEFRNIPQPYFQRYLNSGNILGNNFLVTNEASFAEKISNDIQIYNDRVPSIWSDSRNGNLDIYCNIRSFTTPDTTVGISQISHIVPEKFNLYQNYPNPFNSQTIIKIDLFKKEIYSLRIYNLLGQLVDEIFNQAMNVGSYQINYDASSLPSGVYVYNLSSNQENLVKYFILLK
ncbi:MAG: T9SS type A sorting domain-containing protein [Bacteroidota bacterium]|nr:T9SS type A sorting domain-containing protein [Bacteroidota bacterium]